MKHDILPKKREYAGTRYQSSNQASVRAAPCADACVGDAPDLLLKTVGKRLRALRSQHALTRKTLAEHAGVSERYLAKLESGSGNASILVLRKLAVALHCQPVDLLVKIDGDDQGEWAELCSILRGKTSEELRAFRQSLQNMPTSPVVNDPQRNERIALVGLRGAGKSTLGRMLAEDGKCRFAELSRVVAEIAGCPVPEIYGLYGETAYRRYERLALEHVIEKYPRAVIALPGGLVSESETYALVLKHYFTVWLTATPNDHMARVIAQGDLRPMTGYDEAINDLQRILASRRDQYARADLTHDTSERPLVETYLALRDRIEQVRSEGSRAAT
ncbi:helix-turn-helix transcriptional regulator [Paraburkholderia phenoliruptrix]|uniref:helix-turn-helix transcriptional regulator n=1 Tax=Paraburkholderia phenoliruptrix TaxID=252970 RepID=UPI002869EACE|nr:helix-turn-helix transcriptional regulator [Paraburkholderia phenoliruptrix]WMY09544.1 helix-turn-helix transcriptional regulator [Paraburkholderia phenoliruptrix]